MTHLRHSSPKYPSNHLTNQVWYHQWHLHASTQENANCEGGIEVRSTVENKHATLHDVSSVFSLSQPSACFSDWHMWSDNLTDLMLKYVHEMCRLRYENVLHQIPSEWFKWFSAYFGFPYHSAGSYSTIMTAPQNVIFYVAYNEMQSLYLIFAMHATMTATAKPCTSAGCTLPAAGTFSITETHPMNTKKVVPINSPRHGWITVSNVVGGGAVFFLPVKGRSSSLSSTFSSWPAMVQYLCCQDRLW